LQQNTGGQPLLAIDTFKQFFPNIDPFGGSRLRAHPAANVMGETITDFFDSLNTTDNDYYALIGDEWVATDLINANTNRNFTSWAEFFGPHLYNGDNFTTVVRLLFDSDDKASSLIDEHSNATTSRVSYLMKQLQIRTLALQYMDMVPIQHHRTQVLHGQQKTLFL
jgi:hypothetical protein